MYCSCPKASRSLTQRMWTRTDRPARTQKKFHLRRSIERGRMDARHESTPDKTTMRISRILHICVSYEPSRGCSGDPM
jgi:hypothetical protein